MPTDTLGAAGRSRCADPIGRARHSAECREAPGKSVEKPSRERVASDRFDRICKRGKRLPPKEAYPRRQRNPYRDDPSRRPCTERRPNRPDNLRLPVDSSGTHIAGTPAGSVSAEEVRQRAKRPSVLSLSLIRLGKPGRTKATAGQGGGNPHAQSGRSDARARETDPKKETTPHAEPQRRSRSVVRTRMETADRENNDNRPAGTIRNRSETP